MSANVYQHYRECRAVGQFPDDPLVRRNAAEIQDVEERYAKWEAAKAQTDLLIKAFER